MVFISIMITVLSVCCVGILLFVIYANINKHQCTSEKDLTDKVVIITGANTGIGFETALDLAKRNARVILVCRNKEKGKRAVDKIIAETGNGNVECRLCDTSSMKSVREFCDSFLMDENRLDILINNAGVSGLPLTMTADGLELTWATNYLGHFLMTYLLLDILKRSAPCRIINVSSVMHLKQAKINFDDLFSVRDFRPYLVYRDTKLAQILFSKELAERLSETDVVVLSLHPGIVKTEVTRHNPVVDKVFSLLAKARLLKTPCEGAQTTIHCAVADDVVSGCYYDNCCVATETVMVNDAPLRKRLWSVSEHLVGIQ